MFNFFCSTVIINMFISCSIVKINCPQATCKLKVKIWLNICVGCFDSHPQCQIDLHPTLPAHMTPSICSTIWTQFGTMGVPLMNFRSLASVTTFQTSQNTSSLVHQHQPNSLAVPTPWWYLYSPVHPCLFLAQTQNPSRRHLGSLNIPTYWATMKVRGQKDKMEVAK